MDMMKAIYTFLVVVLGVSTGFAQTTDAEEEYFNANDSIEVEEGNKLQVGLTAGSAVFVGTNGPLFSQYVAPSLNYRFSNRLTVGGGLLFSTGFQNFGNSENSNFYGANNSSTSIFVNSRYKLNNNVTFLGSALYTPNSDGSTIICDPYSQNPGDMLMLGLEFGTGNNSSITFTAGLSRGGNAFNSFGGGFGTGNFGATGFGPMNNSSTGFYSPFGWR